MIRVRVAGAALLTALALLAPVTLSSATPTPPGTASEGFTLQGHAEQGGWLRGTAPPGTRALTLDGVPVMLAGDGSFFIAFDRDAAPSTLLVATRANGRSSHALTVARRGWDVENIDIARKTNALPDADYLRLRAAEQAQISAARAIGSASDGWRQGFIWPVNGRISGRFGAQRVYRGVPSAYHSGLDIATGASGTPYVAPADGVVVLAADHPFSLEGNLLIIDHGMGLSSAFLHSSTLLVHVGDHVRQGQMIGRIGMTGRATGPHLHWSIKWREARLDPALFVPGAP